MRAAEVAGDADFRRLQTAQTRMLSAYRRQDWSAAARYLDECLNMNSDLSDLYDVYRGRIERFRISPPGADWDGVHFDLSK